MSSSRSAATLRASSSSASYRISQTCCKASEVTPMMPEELVEPGCSRQAQTIGAHDHRRRAFDAILMGHGREAWLSRQTPAPEPRHPRRVCLLPSRRCSPAMDPKSGMHTCYSYAISKQAAQTSKPTRDVRA